MPAIPIPRDPSDVRSPSLSIRSLIAPLSKLVPRPFLTTRDTISTPSLSNFYAKANLQSREVNGIIPTYYNFGGPSPGTTVGIVLGSVGGFLLILWLLWSFTQLNGGNRISGEEEVVVRRRRSPHSRRSRRSTRATEVREISRSPRRERIIVEERREVPRPRSIIVEERTRVPNDDIVEVIEEHSDVRPPRRNSGRRGSGYRY